MKILLTTLFLYACFPGRLSSLDVHDMHVSLCELRWNEESSSFEVSIKIFMDDLERAFSKAGVNGLSLGSPKEAPTANDQIAAYLEKHFKIDIDGISLKPVFMGKEVSDDFQGLWCYVEFPAELKSAKKCMLSNDILLDMFEDQRNIMDIRMNKTHKAYSIFQPGHSTWSYSF